MRLISIQVLRAIAALMVLLGHLWPEFEQFGHDNNHIPNFGYGGAGVDLFFVISGFVMVYSSSKLFAAPGGPTEFFLRRLARIVPLYWAVTAIWLYYLLTIRDWNIATEDMSWAQIAASFAFIPFARPSGVEAPVVGVGWTLNYEMFFYLCFAFAVTLPRRAAVASVTILFVVIVTLCSTFMPGQLTAPWTLGDPIILEFAVGMLLALVFLSGYRMPRWASAMLALAGIAAWAYTIRYSYTIRVLDWGIPAAAVVAAVTLCRDTVAVNPVIRALAIIGDASYALYLTHTVDMIIPRSYLAPSIDPVAHPYVYAAILVAFCIGVAIAVHYLLERPVTRALNRLIRARTANRIASVASA